MIRFGRAPLLRRGADRPGYSGSSSRTRRCRYAHSGRDRGTARYSHAEPTAPGNRNTLLSCERLRLSWPLPVAGSMAAATRPDNKTALLNELIDRRPRQ